MFLHLALYLFVLVQLQLVSGRPYHLQQCVMPQELGRLVVCIALCCFWCGLLNAKSQKECL